MKQRILSLLVLLVAAVTGAWAGEPVPEYKLDKGTLSHCDIAFKVNNVEGSRANKGDEVTITVTPNTGYATKNITVTAYMETGQMRVARRAPGVGGSAPASEIVEDITVNTTDNPNVFTITMPKAHVIVDAYTTRILQDSWVEDIDDLTYTGQGLEPALTITVDNTTLVEGTDYTVEYTNNINAALSTAANAPTATITGIGNYSGTVTKTFTINPKALEDEFIAPIEDQTYTGSAVTPAPVVTYNGMTLKAVTDYTVNYSNNMVFGTATLTITGKGNYSGTATANFNISRKSLSTVMIQPIADQTYTGSGITPAFIVKDGDKTLIAGTDYRDIVYTNNTKAAKSTDQNPPTVTITGTGNYKSTVSRFFTINPKPVTNSMIRPIAAQTYTGEALEPSVMVRDGNSTLKSSEYTVEYSNNVNAGTATVTITCVASSNYGGTATATFTINPKTTVDGNITVEEDGVETVLTINDAGTQQGKTVEEDLEVTTLNYYRTLKANEAQAYTICLPYAPPTDPNLKYYTLTSANGEALHFDEIEGEPQANTPYLVMASADVDISKEDYQENFTMSKEVVNSSVAGAYVMKGTLSGFSHDEAVGLYILQSGNRWAKVGSNTKAYIPPFRAYIEVTSAGPERLNSTIGGENSATEITSVCATDNDGTEHWFDLNGQPIEKPTKSGIYIHNGRKEYVK